MMNNSPFSFLCSSPKRASADVPVQQLPEGFLLQLAPAQPHLHPQLLQHLRHVSAQEGRVQQWKHLSPAAWSRSQKVPWVSPGGGCCRGIQILKESLKKFPFVQRRLPKPPYPISLFCAPKSIFSPPLVHAGGCACCFFWQVWHSHAPFCSVPAVARQQQCP